MGGGGATAAFVVVVFALSIVPAVDAGHCETGIVAYGRGAFAPGVLPPASPVDRLCFELESTTTAGHFLPPGTDQVYVRAQIDNGANYPVLQLRLDGLGWHHQIFFLNREEGVAGAFSYNVDDWIPVPDPEDPDPTLRMTVRYPSATELTAHTRILRLPTS